MAEKSQRGFAAMDRAKQRAIASKGGKAAHAKGTAHEFTPDEARAAGRKGGQAAHAKGTAHEFTPEEARAAGRKGGQSSHGSQTPNAPNTPPIGEIQSAPMPSTAPTEQMSGNLPEQPAMSAPQPQGILP